MGKSTLLCCRHRYLLKQAMNTAFLIWILCHLNIMTIFLLESLVETGEILGKYSVHYHYEPH